MGGRRLPGSSPGDGVAARRVAATLVAVAAAAAETVVVAASPAMSAAAGDPTTRKTTPNRTLVQLRHPGSWWFNRYCTMTVYVCRGAAVIIRTGGIPTFRGATAMGFLGWFASGVLTVVASEYGQCVRAEGRGSPARGRVLLGGLEMMHGRRQKADAA